MVLLYLLILLPIFIKKYLDYQDSKINSAHYYTPKETSVSYGSDAYFDQYSLEYFNLLIKCLIFCTYGDKKFSSVRDYISFGEVGDDLKTLTEEKEIESIFRNKFIDKSLRPKLSTFKSATNEITEEEWLFESIDLEYDERWKKINSIAEELLTEMNIKERGFDFALYVPQ